MTLETQKLEFAKRYFRNPTDAVMIAASILGADATEANPMVAINAGREWPQDEIVLAELERLRSETKPKSEYAVIARHSYQLCMDMGETKSAVEFLKLAAQLDGHLKGGAVADEGKRHGEDNLAELAAMVVDPTDTGG